MRNGFTISYPRRDITRSYESDLTALKRVPVRPFKCQYGFGCTCVYVNFMKGTWRRLIHIIKVLWDVIHLSVPKKTSANFSLFHHKCSIQVHISFDIMIHCCSPSICVWETCVIIHVNKCVFVQYIIYTWKVCRSLRNEYVEWEFMTQSVKYLHFPKLK